MGLGLKVLPLTKTRRCPKSHVRIAQQYVPDFEATEDAPEGEVQTVSLEQAGEMIQEGDMVQCRNNAPLAGFCFRLLRRELKVQIVGRDIGQGLIALIKRMKASDIPNLIEKIEVYRGKELVKADKQRNAAAAADFINDKCDTIVALTDGVDDVTELVSKIEHIFRDCDDSGVPKQSVLLTTTHRAKGLEADTVWVLDPSLYPAKYAVQPWEIEQEKNLMYVRDTRSKNKLIYIVVTKK